MLDWRAGKMSFQAEYATKKLLDVHKKYDIIESVDFI